MHLDANGIELFAQPSRIGINGLTYQQLITYGDDFGRNLLRLQIFSAECILNLELFLHFGQINLKPLS